MRGGVFVCHASEDAGVAHRVVAALEAGGVPCWVAPRDIAPGESYSLAILDGLEAAPALVLVFSAATNASPHVTRELESAVSRGIPIVPVRLDPVEPSRDLRYFIGTSQWLDTGGVAAEQWEPPLVRAVRKVIGATLVRIPDLPIRPADDHGEHDNHQDVDHDDEREEVRRARWPWAVAAAVGVAAVVVVVVLLTRSGDDEPSASAGLPERVPAGRAGMATVFPSLGEECEEVEPALDAKSEVYVCRAESYLIRYSRWDDDYDRAGFLDSLTGVESTTWTRGGHDLGDQWTYEATGVDRPFGWSATYAELPFSVDVEASSPKARAQGLALVEALAPGGGE